MANHSKKRDKRRKRVLIIELVVLTFLALVLIVLIKGTQLLNSINYEELDSDKIITADEANGQYDSEIAVGSVDEEESSYSGYDIIALVGLDSRSGEDASENSDTMMICVIDHDNKTIKLCSVYRDTYLNIGEDYYGNSDSYQKSNAAYNLGGAEQFLSMLNLNLDLNITQHITVDFTALAVCIDLLGGIDIPMTREEAVHVNNYNIETAAETGVEYEALEIPDDENYDGDVTVVYHCNGSQAVSYARVRYTAGNDFRRTSRQREVLSLVKEKAMESDIFTLASVLEEVLPYVTTNIDSASLISLALSIYTYEMSDEDMDGFPFVHAEMNVSGVGSCVIPVTLEYNVTRLHEFLFPNVEYSPSTTVQNYSSYISSVTGFTSDDIEYYSSIYDYSDLAGITEEEYLEWLETQ